MLRATCRRGHPFDAAGSERYAQPGRELPAALTAATIRLEG
jgi:hypothetical protein